MFNTFFFKPLYNGLIFLIGSLPFLDAGMAVVLFTIIVKLILFPLTRSSVITQLKMKKYGGELEELKKKHTDRQELALKTMQFYKEKNIRPFSSFFLVLIQFPIIIALFLVFKNGFPVVNGGQLYSFIHIPAHINPFFLGLINVSSKSWILAFCAAITYFFQVRFSMPATPKKEGAAKSFQDDFNRSMQMQMKYMMPFIIFFIAYSASAAVALYWATSNLFTIGQELVIRRKFAREQQNNEKK